MTDKQTTAIMAAILFEKVSAEWNLEDEETRKRTIKETSNLAEDLYLSVSDKFTD